MESRLYIYNNKHEKLVGVHNHFSDDWLTIFCHGYTGSKDQPGIIQTAAQLNQRGISTFRFDFSGSGESEGQKLLSLKQQVADLQAVIDYFQVYRQIVLLGGSLGALPVVICANHCRVNRIITVNGYFEGKILWQPFKQVHQYLRMLSWFVPRIKSEFRFLHQQLQPELISKPSLLIYTKLDEVIDYHQSIQFYDQLRCQKQLLELPLTNHGMENPADAEKVVKEVLAWIHLQ